MKSLGPISGLTDRTPLPRALRYILENFKVKKQGNRRIYMHHFNCNPVLTAQEKTDLKSKYIIYASTMLQDQRTEVPFLLKCVKILQKINKRLSLTEDYLRNFKKN